MAREEGTSGLVFLALGTALGAALGVLFAPKSGKETREDIAEWLKDRRQKGSELLHKLKEEIPAKKDQFAAAIKAGKEAYKEAAKSNGLEKKEGVHA